MTYILLAEDDPNLGLVLHEYLEAKNFKVDLAINGDEALNFFLKNTYDFCILDVMMPKKDGFSLAKEIRIKNPNIPILFLTAKSMPEDLVKGYELGADDYMKKPFSMEELQLRITAILRRSNLVENVKEKETRYSVGKYTFYTHTQILESEEGQSKLSTKESRLLQLFCENPHASVSRSYALKLIWGDDSYFNARSMDVYVTKLRKYFKSDPSIQIINLHGEGFKFIF